MVTIPLVSLPAYTIEVTLDEVAYLLTIRWNTRASQYTLEIASRDGTTLVGGIGLMLDSEMLRCHAGKGLPPGAMYLVDPAGGLQDVAYEDLDTRCRLVYVTEAEYAAL